MIVTNNKEKYQKMGWDSFGTVEDVLTYFKDAESVQLDLETSGSSFLTSNIHSLQLGDAENQFLIDIESGVDIKLFKDLIEGVTIIGQNLAFDIPFLYYNDIVPCEAFDTLLAEQVLTMGMMLPRGSRSLGALVEKYVGVEMDKSEQGTIADTGIDSLEAIEYALADVRYLHTVGRGQWKEIKKWGLQETIRLENAFLFVLAYIEYSGVKVDKDRWMGNVRKIEYLEYKTWLELTEEYIKLDGIDTPPVFPQFPVNWNSSKQVVEVMKRVDVPVVDAKTGKETVDAKHLASYSHLHPIVPLYLKYKEYNKEVTTYGREWLNNVLSDGKVHTKYKSIMDTGRTSCGDTRFGPFPNMQNLPSSESIRNCFIPTNKRNTFVVCDYSSQESVLLADMSQEQNLLDFYINGEADLHSYAASKIWSKEIGNIPLEDVKKNFPEYRQKAKSANFAISYGGSGVTIARNLNIPKSQGEEVYDAYMKAFPGLAAFFDRQKKLVFHRGYILVNPKTGRKRFGNDVRDVYKKFENINWTKYKKGGEYKEEALKIIKQKSGIERESLNTPIQGTAADMSKLAGVLFLKWIKEKKLFGKVLIPIFIHDEYVVECTKGKADMVGEKLKECMETAGEHFLSTLKIKAEPVTTEKWEH